MLGEDICHIQTTAAALSSSLPALLRPQYKMAEEELTVLKETVNRSHWNQGGLPLHPHFFSPSYTKATPSNSGKKSGNTLVPFSGVAGELWGQVSEELCFLHPWKILGREHTDCLTFPSSCISPIALITPASNEAS